jgi:hypothetical protein
VRAACCGLGVGDCEYLEHFVYLEYLEKKKVDQAGLMPWPGVANARVA